MVDYLHWALDSIISMEPEGRPQPLLVCQPRSEPQHRLFLTTLGLGLPLSSAKNQQVTDAFSIYSLV